MNIQSRNAYTRYTILGHKQSLFDLANYHPYLNLENTKNSLFNTLVNRITDYQDKIAG